MSGDQPASGRPRGLILRVMGRVPTLGRNVFIAPGAIVAGDIDIGDDGNVWPGCVLRGDYGSIRIGERTNIQDGTIIHATAALPTVIGADCVVGHGARLEGCEIEDAVLVGMGAILLHGVHVGRGAVVAAGAVVAPGTKVPAGAMAVGVPARIRDAEAATGAERLAIHTATAAFYVDNARRWAESVEVVNEG